MTDQTEIEHLRSLVESLTKERDELLALAADPANFVEIMHEREQMKAEREKNRKIIDELEKRCLQCEKALKRISEALK